MDTVNTSSIINLLLAFLEGLALIISPCILPLLPIFLAGSLEGSKKRPLGIILGFILAFAFFSITAKKIVQLSGIDLNIVRYVSFGLLMMFGIIMISNYLSAKVSQGLQRITYWVPSSDSLSKSGFFSGIFFGVLLGLVWTPCAGPILAAVIVQTVLQETTFASFLTLLAFGIGVSIPMLLIVFLGRTLMEKFNFFKQHSTAIRKILGLLIILGVILMIYADRIIFWLSSPSSTPITSLNTGLTDGLTRPYPAPPLEDISYWINTKPLELSEMKGKVILIDFWTYSCINCIRTLPYLKSWYQKYKDQGLVIIGVHTPEFDFEKDINNVRSAVQNYGIDYPVVLDNQYSTWRNYLNHYWPASYLINKNGEVVYKHFGEGNYSITEDNIKFLLGLPAAAPSTTEPGREPDATETATTESSQNNTIVSTLMPNFQTPETYLGYERANAFASKEAPSIFYNKPKEYSYPRELRENTWALQGKWTVFQSYILTNQADAAIQIHFTAGKVYAVMGSNTKQGIQLELLLNGQKLASNQAGKDVKNSQILITDFKLYELINSSRTINGILELIVSEPGLELYTFTFGN